MQYPHPPAGPAERFLKLEKILDFVDYLPRLGAVPIAPPPLPHYQTLLLRNYLGSNFIPQGTFVSHRNLALLLLNNSVYRNGNGYPMILRGLAKNAATFQLVIVKSGEEIPDHWNKRRYTPNIYNDLLRRSFLLFYKGRKQLDDSNITLAQTYISDITPIINYTILPRTPPLDPGPPNSVYLETAVQMQEALELD